MSIYNRLAAMVGLTLVAALATAGPNPVGTWTGHIHVTPPANMNPQQKQLAEQQLALLAKTVLTLALNSDHTFKAMMKRPNAPAPQTDGGKWTLSKNIVALSGGKGGPRQFTLSANGKTMKATVPGGGAKIEIEFDRK
jgi:hypothetical protein